MTFILSKMKGRSRRPNH